MEVWRRSGCTHTWFEIDEDGAGDVVLVVCLVEEYVFTVAAFGRPFLENALLVDAVLGAEALPEDGADFEGSR